MEARARSTLAPESYKDKWVTIKDCKVIPTEQKDNQFLHTITDGKSEIIGVAIKKTKGQMTLKAKVSIDDDGKPYLGF